MNSTNKAEMQEEDFVAIEGENPELHNEEAEEDTRLSDDRNEDDDARREAKRNERQRRKQNQRFARDKSKEEMQYLISQNQALMQRLEAVESHAIQSQKGSLDQNYNQAIYTVQTTEQALAKAIELGDGARVPDLLRQRDQAMAKAAEINRMKQNFDSPRQTQSSEVTQRAQKWASENPWFNANSTDADSMAAKQIDSSLVAEGLDPSSKKYWKELNRRIADRLPHRFAQEEDSGYSGEERSGRRGPPVGGSRDISAPGSKKVFVSSERVQAMKDAGYWDDPVLRQRMLKRYSEVDRENRAAR